MSESYDLNLSVQDVYLMYHCVCKRIETWEGYPARPAEEQEHLWYLKDWLYRIILEEKFNNM